MDSKSNRTPFLQRLADEVKHIADARLIVFPNKRSMWKFNEYFGSDQNAAALFTVDDLMQELSGLRLIEPEELLVAFYQGYCKIEPQPQPFDQFTNWAIPFLADANDLDLHLCDVDKLYAHIQAYHETGESFSRENSGALEVSFLSFWNRLPNYYRALRNELDQIKLGYRGLVYRTVAELAAQNAAILSEKLADGAVCWVGIIPGNASEQQLLKWIDEHGKLHVFADMDRFYIEREHHEAGRLFRQADQLTKTWQVNLLATKTMHVDCHPISGEVGQLIRAREIIDAIDPKLLSETVIVLANEALLTPFLTVFSDMKNEVNISMGFPLKNTMVHRFVMTWVELHSGAIQRNGKKLFYYKQLEKLLEFPVVRLWLDHRWDEIHAVWVKENMKFVSTDWLFEKLNGEMFGQRAYEVLFSWSNNTSLVFDKINELIADWERSTDRLAMARIEREALPVYRDKLKQLMAQFNEVLDHTDLRGLRKFLHRHISYTKLNLSEAKNEGLQIMGMLETRMVDFKHVIIVGAADDTLPGNPTKSSFIPFIHREAFGLPTRKDTEALMAYHFYRLLQRCDHLHLIYNTSSKALSGGEPSRYIRQLKDELAFENPKVTIEEKHIPILLNADSQQDVIIEKTPEVIASTIAYLKSRLSPTALNKFVNSPLEFYFYYVLGAKEQEKVEEDMEASTFGSVVHSVLEDLYSPFLGNLINLETLEKSLSEVSDHVNKKMGAIFPSDELKQGRNFIMVELAKMFITRFVQYDLSEMRENGPVKLIALELPFNPTLASHGFDLRMFGLADRVDERMGTIRIIDYKTGLVVKYELKSSFEEMRSNSKKSKALQLAFYKWAYAKINHVQASQIQSCIFSFRNMSEGYIPLVVDSEDEKFVGDFEEMLNNIVSEMLDPAEPFQHKIDSEYITI